MIKARKLLEAELIERFTALMSERKTARLSTYAILIGLYEKYNYPSNLATPVIHKTRAIEQLTSEELFWFASVTLPERLQEYYSETEIKKYSMIKYVKEEMSELSIQCVEVVAGKQWIGVLPNAAKTLMDLRDNNKIFYNPNAQRAMTMERIKDGRVLWRITLHKNVLNKIRECFRSEKFVPNTITLNIDPDTDTEVYYSNGELRVTNLDHFDIIDGFHRFVALCKERTSDPEFCYPMEIRITRYSDAKASYFVWQEDQKTPMKKKEAAALNTESIESKIARRLNESDGCLQDQIGRNNGLIRTEDLVYAIKKVYDTDKIEILNTAEFVKETAKQINRKWNEFIDKYGSHFENGYSSDDIHRIVQCCKEDLSIDDMSKQFTWED